MTPGTFSTIDDRRDDLQRRCPSDGGKSRPGQVKARARGRAGTEARPRQTLPRRLPSTCNPRQTPFQETGHTRPIVVHRSVRQRAPVRPATPHTEPGTAAVTGRFSTRRCRRCTRPSLTSPKPCAQRLASPRSPHLGRGAIGSPAVPGAGNAELNGLRLHSLWGNANGPSSVARDWARCCRYPTRGGVPFAVVRGTVKRTV